MELFPELNIDYFQIITKKWIDKYQPKGVNFSRIVLYRYASDYFGSKVPVKYAIVFEMPHYEPAPRPDAADTEKHLKWLTTSSNNPENPYENFIYRDLDYNSTISQGLPSIMALGNFGSVYNPPLREGFESEWALIPQYKGLTLPLQIRVDEGCIVLYDENYWREKTKTHSLYENDAIIINDRSEDREHAAWEKNIQPIVDLYYNDGFEYKFFPKPSVITQGDINLMLRKTMMLCYQGYDLIFPTDVFEIQVIKSLHDGLKSFKKIGLDDKFKVDLKSMFHTFLTELFEEETLPIYLAFLYLNYPDGIWPQEEQKKDCSENEQNKIEQLNKQLDEKLAEIYQELEKFYADLVEEIDLGNYGVTDSINTIDAENLHEIALNYFDRKQSRYKVIKKELIQKEKLYTFSNNRRRMFIRNILQEYLKGNPAMNNKKIPTSKEELHKRYNRVNGLT